jgi:hypothetical protein
MLLSNRDGMKVKERGHHSHSEWKLDRQGLQLHRDQPRSNSELGESQRNQGRATSVPAVEENVHPGCVVFLSIVLTFGLMYARHRHVTYAWYDNHLAVSRSRDDRGQDLEPLHSQLHSNGVG